MEQELLTASECILKHKLNWTVSQRPIFYKEEGEWFGADEYRAVVRDDNSEVLHIAKAGYTPIQNAEAFSFFDEIVKTGAAKYDKAGSYKGGRVVYLRARVPQFDSQPLPGDSLEAFIELQTSHDGSYSLAAVCRSYRKVCTNGTHAWVNAGRVAVRHTSGAKERFKAGGKLLMAKWADHYARLNAHYAAMANKKMNAAAMDSFLNNLFQVKEDAEESARLQNKMAKIEQLASSGTGQNIPGVRGTAGAAYNAVTEWIDRYRPAGSQEERSYAADFGGGADLRERAFALLTR